MTSLHTMNKVICLTTIHPPSDWVNKPFVDELENAVVAKHLLSRGAHVDLRSYLDPSLNAATLSEYTHLVFITACSYNLHAPDFLRFLKDILPAAKTLNPALRVCNNPSTVFWNYNKNYLTDLSNANIIIPCTDFVPISSTLAIDALKARLSALGSTPVVLKPSISSFSYLTHRITNPSELVPSDEDFLARILSIAAAIPSPQDPSPIGALMIQAFLPAINTRGEYSLVFIAGELTHCVIKATSKTDFRVGSDFGGSTTFVKPEALEGDAVEVAWKMWKLLNKKSKDTDGETLAYLRVDGVTGDDGKFVVMEAECIEPYLWLQEDADVGGNALELLGNVILGASGSHKSIDVL